MYKITCAIKMNQLQWANGGNGYTLYFQCGKLLCF